MVNSPPPHICWGAAHNHPKAHQLSLEGISVRYGDVLALDNIHMSINCGHSLALIGPNGAGKSSLINAIAGLIPLESGKILWEGAALPRHEIAFMPQRSEIDWSFPLTVRQLVEMGRYPALGLWKSMREHDHDIVEKALASLQITDLQDRQIGALSGGQQQRAFLARALAQEAHILLLDEPFTGLDLTGTHTLADLLRDLAQEGRLVIASHHDLKTAPLIFDQCMLLRQRLIASGKTEDVLTQEHLRTTYGKHLPL